MYSRISRKSRIETLMLVTVAVPVVIAAVVWEDRTPCLPEQHDPRSTRKAMDMINQNRDVFDFYEFEKVLGQGTQATYKAYHKHSRLPTPSK